MEIAEERKEEPQIRTANRSRAYLIYIFKDYGSVFFNTFVKERKCIINLYIRDFHYEECNGIDYLNTPLVYVRVDLSLIQNKKEYFKIMRSSRYFRAMYNHSFLNEEMVLVFDIKETYHNAYYCFLRSEYSKMYTKAQLKAFNLPKIKEGQMSPSYCTLHGLPDRYDFYQAVVMLRFDVPIDIVAPVDSLKEYDIPIDMRQESLNYNLSWKAVKNINLA